jgi:hypothetical protein
VYDPPVGAIVNACVSQVGVPSTQSPEIGSDATKGPPVQVDVGVTVDSELLGGVDANACGATTAKSVTIVTNKLIRIDPPIVQVQLALKMDGGVYSRFRHTQGVKLRM